ncbi:hypothetical protein ABB37_07969 [Leptomonas pyrrhocoris]|uniref:PCIF1 WW domain-containing protein n=1 Tax=Leptomonas pyrrhocoris TaxID=157538 RepID=A0A0N0DSP3_LEPPY|nr:hypothetical protein ABB37_07969 [Leptomonas pyrrhocoris]XP_015654661.1 hypothetical protein ABB37_07969 [Leptomonas pyrrhocoris]KPA76221.1 hypothetical protein ABB37_07969 [Leptomonas pyrrhocoris]KPA76222.1 hypothetical protein ABB37_07969 [Leptomonas pyrrhocoris]|eukprot:XP_015654660.1 hypothetical protein ABB37_07969 [Leptomonas pyrrhocoris]
MNVRQKREGVEQVFADDRVVLIMQEALQQRYSSPPGANDKDASSSTTGRFDQNQSSTPSSSPTTTNEVTDSLKQRLRIPFHYTLRRHSRTAHFLFDSPAFRSCLHHDEAASATAPRSFRSRWWCEAEAYVAQAVVAECLRHLSFLSLMQVDLRNACGLPDATFSVRGDADHTPTAVTSPLATWQEYFELPPRWVMQGLGAVDQHVLSSAAAWRVRRGVTPLDVGATVVKRDHSASTTTPATAALTAEATEQLSVAAARHHYRVVATASMARGAYWVDVAPVDPSATAAVCVERVDRETLWLDPPVPLHVDPLLPCDELYSDRGVSTGIYVFFLRALQQQQQQKKRRTTPSGKKIHVDSNRQQSTFPSSGSNEPKDLPAVAADVSLRLARCARQRRAELADSLQRLSSDARNSATLSNGGAPRGQPSITPVVPALLLLLQVRVDVARGCLQLRVREMESASPDLSVHPAREGAATASADRKRPRGDADTNMDAQVDREVKLPARVSSPTVAVLLRSARKLAALYDTTRAASLAPPPQDEEKKIDTPCSHEHQDTHDWEVDSPPPHLCEGASVPSSVASSVLEDLIKRAEVEAAASAPPGTWHNLVLGRADASLSFAERPSSIVTTFGSAEKAFLARLFTLLLRYRSLFGEQGYNQGPQAAVPPPIMDKLARTFHIRAEAFASPLNAQLPQFGSLFPDTDAFFGSMGSFFDLMLGRGAASSEGDAHGSTTAAPVIDDPSCDECHVEVNPPFDTTLLRRMEEHLLTCLKKAASSTQSLLFLIVLPSHDLDDREAKTRQASGAGSPALSYAAGHRIAASAVDAPNSKASASSPLSSAAAPLSTDRSLRESPYCLAHVLCDAADSVYVDGHQHLLVSPFFCIGTPTRLILLGNRAARVRFPSAAAQLDEVRLSWKRLTEGAMKR